MDGRFLYEVLLKCNFAVVSGTLGVRFKYHNGKHMSQLNYFRCPICSRVTQHIESTGAEWMAQNSEGAEKTIMTPMVRLSDYMGFTKMIEKLIGAKSWKCSQCATVTRYNEDGSLYRGG